MAVPDHIVAVNNVSIVPINAQQSMRENERIGRNPQIVLDDLMWATFESDLQKPWGADADHAHAGPIDVLIPKGKILPWENLETTVNKLSKRYLDPPIRLEGLKLHFSKEELNRVCVKYSRTLVHIKRLPDICCLPINKMDDLRRAISMRVAYFVDHGCVLSDQALDPVLFKEATEDELDEILRKAKNSEPITNQEKAAYQTAILIVLAEEYNAKGWVMQIHFGCIHDIVSRMFSSLGPNTGYDAIEDTPSAKNLALLLDAFDSLYVIPKMVIYPMNSTLNNVVSTIAGCFHTDNAFPSKVQFRSAWWFNDHKLGIEKQLSDLSNTGLLGSFIGMLTDSRSFLSYTRHEYFRRILCNFIGQIVDDGEYPYPPKFLGDLVENVSYFTALRFFEFRSLSSIEVKQ